MNFPVPTQSYTQGTGSASNSVFITTFNNRAPNGNDIQYPVTKRWVNTVTFKEYILTGFSTAGGASQAIWINLTNGTVGSLDELTGNSGINPVLPDSDLNINIRGDSTSINITGSAHTLTANVVLPSTPDVVLIGETNSISSIANGTEGQILTSHASGPPTFENSTSGLTIGPFGSTPNTSGGTISSGVLTLQPANATNPGGVTASGTQVWGGVKSFSSAPIVPLTGILIGNGSTAVTNTTVTNNAAIVGGAANALVSIPLNNGQFVIGATSGAPAAGTITAGTGITVTPSANGLTVASSAVGFIWVNENSGNFVSLSAHGYIINTNTPASTTLPTSAVLGDTISYMCQIANVLTINCPTGQSILIGTSVTATAGSAVNTAIGDAITLVYTGFNIWQSLNAPQGVWILS